MHYTFSALKCPRIIVLWKGRKGCEESNEYRFRTQEICWTECQSFASSLHLCWLTYRTSIICGPKFTCLLAVVHHHQKVNENSCTSNYLFTFYKNITLIKVAYFPFKYGTWVSTNTLSLHRSCACAHTCTCSMGSQKPTYFNF